MNDLQLLQILVCIAALPAVYILWDRHLSRGKYKLPPTVPGLPLIGNTFQLPRSHLGPWAKEQTDKYGEMFTCRIGSYNWVFLNSSRVVIDLLEKRAAKYSSRPSFPMASTLISDDYRILLQPYGDQWRSTRKIMHGLLNKQNMPSFVPFQELESQHLVYDVLHHPEDWHSATSRFANSVIMGVIFGRRLQLGDPDIRAFFETHEAFIAALQPGAYMVDAFTFLDKLPNALQWWRPRGDEIRKMSLGVYRRMVDDLKRKTKDGTAKMCFAIQFLEDPATKDLPESQLLFTLGSLVEAGMDTSRTTIFHAIASAATDKRWLKQVQKELDDICGSVAERLPRLSDQGQLPYITAVVKECYRWYSTLEIGPPHMLIEDDEYEGYHFPAGTLFTWNNWAINLDPKEYDEPERFWPDRWLHTGKDLYDPTKGHWGFGPGRRACPGYHVGDSNVWIAVARLIYCFNFEEIPGEPIDPINVNWLQHREAPFAVKPVVRSPQHAALIDLTGLAAVNTKY